MTNLWVASHVLLWVIVVVEGALILSLMRQVGSLLLRVGSAHAVDAGTGPVVGELAPWLPTPLSVPDESARTSSVLLFMSMECGSCVDLVPAVNAVASSYRSLGVAAVAREPEDEVKRWIQRVGLKVPMESFPGAFDQYGIRGTPYAFVFDGHGRVAARGGVNHIEHLEALIRSCVVAESAEAERVELPLLGLAKGDDVHAG